MTHALIVIDMQQGPFGDTPPWHDVVGLVGRLNRLADAVRTSGGAVIFIQHDGPPGDPHHPDSPGWRFLSDLDVRPVDTVIRKESCDAFLHTSRGVPAGAGHRSADRHRLGDHYCVDHHSQRPGARLYDDRAFRWSPRRTAPPPPPDHQVRNCHLPTSGARGPPCRPCADAVAHLVGCLRARATINVF
jgi:hypothetical protein